MLRDYFTNRWIIGAGCLLIVFGIACYVWYQQELTELQRQASKNAERRQVTERALKTETVHEVEQARSDTSVESTTPNAEKQRTEISETNAELTLLREKLAKMTRAEFEALPPVEQEALKQAARAAFWADRGLAPPPPGYTYLQNQDGYHLVKHGEPLFQVTWDNYGYHNDYQLSDTEWEEYKALDVIANMGLPGPRQPQATPEVVALAKEWYEQLKEKTWGPRPDLSVSSSFRGVDTQAGQDRMNQLVLEKLNSLTPPPRDSTIDYVVVDRLLAELKAELQRR